jgi:hypothetical protein
MTLVAAYENVLTLLNKEEAPAILVSDFNMYWNKAVTQYVNERYSLYDSSQQTTDDLSWLVKTGIPLVKTVYTDSYKDQLQETDRFWYLPPDYLHLLRVKVFFEQQTGRGRCGVEEGKHFSMHSRRVTAEMQSGADQNYYFRPSLKRPYHFISKFDTERIKNKIDNIEYQYNLEIRAGDTIDHGDRVTGVEIDYLRKPRTYSLTKEKIKRGDSSDVLEMTDYTINEILNRCAMLLLEKGSDPRINTLAPVTSTIPGAPQKK